ncbi:MAG TPA: LysR family transcriptional regulator [Caulobacteraceae bacterium]|jgi:DNA-binding transcriptional LysR family regulator|nr:LysR family transcriptional regulator [Caulobacteraceae bacterium]
MLLRHLSYFVTLARERHFARAADACHVAQPTLSAAIRKLEEDLGARLVVRGHSFVGLTSEGERVLAWGRQILTDYDNLRDDLSSLRKGMVGTLRIGCIPAAMPSVAFLTARFCKDHPAAQVAIRSLTSRAIQAELDAFDIDAGITYLENEPLEHVRRVPLYTERYVFVTGHGHAQAARKTISWAEAADERLCLLSEDMQNRRILNNVAAAAGIALTPTVTSNSFLALFAHLRQGGWSSIVPHTFSYLLGDARELVAIELEPAHTQVVGLVLSNRDPPAPMASALLASVMDIDVELAFGAAG